MIARNANFRWLWTGQLVSQMGTKIHLVALAWYFVHGRNENQALVLMLLSGSLPILFLGPFAGPFVDRWDRRRLLVAADLASAAFALLIAAAVAFSLPPLAIYVGVFLLGLAEVLFNPSARALVPSIVTREEVQEATSSLSLVYNVASLAGAASGGVLVGLLGVTNAILVNAASFLASALASSRISAPPAPSSATGPFLSELRAGIASLKERPAVLRLLVLSSLLNLFFVPVVVYLPVLVDDVLGLSSLHFGAAEACAPVGSLLAGLVCAVRPTERHLAFVKGGIVALGASFLAVALLRSYPGTLVSMALMGATLTVINVHSVSWFTKSVVPGTLGRFFNLMETISFGTFPLAYLLAGLLVARVDLYVLFFAHGLILAGLGVAGAAALGSPATVPSEE